MLSLSPTIVNAMRMFSATVLVPRFSGVNVNALYHCYITYHEGCGVSARARGVDDGLGVGGLDGGAARWIVDMCKKSHPVTDKFTHACTRVRTMVGCAHGRD